MSDQIQIFGIQFPAWVIIPVTYFVWVTFLLFVKNISFHAIKKIAGKTKTNLDDIFIQAIDFPLFLLIFTSGGAIVERMRA